MITIDIKFLDDKDLTFDAMNYGVLPVNSDIFFVELRPSMYAYVPVSSVKYILPRDH